MGCCTNACLVIFTILTIGITLLFMILATIISNLAKNISDTVFKLFLVSTVITAFILIFAIYASCHENKCAKGVLGTIFLIYTLFLIICSIIVLLFRNNFSKIFHDSFDGGKLSDDNIDKIETLFECQFPSKNTTDLSLLENSSESCFTKLERLVNKFGLIFGIVFIVLSAFIFIGIIIAYYEACKKKESSSMLQMKEKLNTPLAYGW